jgi:putative solute:sodium symporter small subunit
MTVTRRQRVYWRKNLTITASLLAVWFVVTFVVSFFARELSFSFFGWPFSFWMGAQGALLVYGAIIWFYARYMDKLDAHYAMQEDEEA